MLLSYDESFFVSGVIKNFMLIFGFHPYEPINFYSAELLKIAFIVAPLL
jgi:hypothetical protein